MAAIWPAMNARLALIPTAHAKMRQDKLTIVSAAGGTEHSFKVEIASTDQEKALGLMYRTALSDGEGMLFPYPAERPLQMWMRNTYISLDMLFIRADGTIARIEERADPLSDRVISSGSAVLAVLEIPGGASARLGIKPGDKVRYPVFSEAGGQ
ncbi:DUF192 domain-containing protein [Hyphomicrobium sp.]|uniref:DUF192 domain-containing protein n=1 Tax=Hyphomicrobium sp. TaxID=82 RepID=UPI002D76EFEF|nr:DUF192 domain-containing protein [Hyphomicrobium sp.]HET6387921.1 DUF192 domain-containing protein [Hyphomicrobium sp.]